MANDNSIKFVVGEEKRLTDILGDADVLPLLKGAVSAGAAAASVTDAEGNPLWTHRGLDAEGAIGGTVPIYLEGELVGRLLVRGADKQEGYLKGIAILLADVLNTLVTSNLKRMLTTEAHTATVNQSYEELLEATRQLAVSERKYRELARQLEIKVEERSRELKEAHVRLLQQEKMASVGQLAAGVAHEINNPMGFINSNLNTLNRYVARFIMMLDFYRSLVRDNPATAEVAGQAEQKWRELKLDTICADIDDLLMQSLEGAERVRRIVADLKGFSHIDDPAEGEVDLNREIDRTLSVVSHSIPAGAEIVREMGALPGFVCNPALICQVFLNIIQNALQARSDGLRLVIGTACDGSSIRLTFSDNGPGVPEEMRGRIFEPFYTTREVGKGTGMGLAVVYEIVSGYGGSIEVASSPGGGAVFTIVLPR